MVSARAKKPLASTALFEAAGLRCSMRFSGGTSAFGRWKEEFLDILSANVLFNPVVKGWFALHGVVWAQGRCGTIPGFVYRVLESVMNRANVLAEIS